jgi:transcriptional regulator with XRE-family HTH domain
VIFETEAVRALAQLRADKGWTQAEMARRMGVHTTYVQKVEAGKRDLTLRYIARAADALGATVSLSFNSEVAP